MNDEQKQLVTKLIDELSILRSGLTHTARQALDRLGNMTGPANELHQSLIRDLELEEPGSSASGAIAGDQLPDLAEADRQEAAERSMLEQRDARVVNEENMIDVETPVVETPDEETPEVETPDVELKSEPDTPDTPAPPAPSVPRKSGRKHQH